MGAANTKVACDQFTANLETNDQSGDVPWYSDVKVDENGCRVFDRLPAPGQHPRLLFTKEEIPRILATHTHTLLKTVLGGSRRNRVNRFQDLYAEYVAVSSEERQSPSRATLDQFFRKDAERNQTWFMAFVDAFLKDDSDLMNKVKELVLFHATIVIKAAEMARTECVKEGNYGIWHNTFWDMQTTWLMGGFSFALMYDLLHEESSEEERCLMRKAISTAITGRRAWGMGWPSRRIQSNWAPYHGGLLTMACAIEGEEGEDKEVVSQFTELMNTFLDFTIYDSGHPIEDSYFPNLALREGSVTFMLLARRGFNMLAKKNYVNVIKKWLPYALEPQPDGEVYGGSSGSCCPYPGGFITAKYAYPKDPVVDFVYRHYLRQNGKEYHRLSKTQTDWMAALFALPALNETLASNSPDQDVHAATECGLSKTFTCFNRGKVIMRSDWSQQALSFVLDARPDGFLIGHDAPSRGAFVLHAHGRSWAACPEWNLHKQSTYYSLITVDGIGYLPKAPWVKLLSSIEGAKESTFAAADLTYAANYEWTQWATASGKQKYINEGWEPEPQDPRDYGMNTWWLPNRVFDEPDVAFTGLYQWRRRFNDVAQTTRSTLMVREAEAPFVIISDDAAKGDEAEHDYVWNMTMPSDAVLVSFDGTDAVIGESSGGDRRLVVRLLDESTAGKAECNIHTSEVINPKNHNDKHIYNRLQFKLKAVEAHFKIGLFPLPCSDAPLPTTTWAKGSLGDKSRTLAVDGSVLIEFSSGCEGAKETGMKVVN